MRPGLFRARRFLPLLLTAVGSTFLSCGQASVARASVTPAPTPAVVTPGVSSTAQPSGALDFSKVETARDRDQIARVVEAMDETGAPPSGVAQGGRRGAKKGVFQNAEGRLPRKPVGYWIESDVWPKHGARDAERLIFGRGHEVYWTHDHYQTFSRLR